MSNYRTSAQRLTADDLKDERLSKLNAAIEHLQNQIEAIQGAGGEYYHRRPFRAKRIRLKNANIPEGDYDVLTLGAARALFSPDVTRDAFAKRQWRGQGVRGLPSSAIDTLLPGPISGISIDPVDYTDPNIAHITGTATVPAIYRDFNGCEVFIVVDPTGTPSDPISVGHQFHDPANTAGPYSFDIRPPRPYAAATWRIFFASRNADGANDLVTAAGPTQTPYADVSISGYPGILDNVGYPTLDSILEEGGLVGTQPWVKLTFNYTAPSSGDFIGFSLFFSDDGETTWEMDEGFRAHPGGADGASSSVHIWRTKPEDSDLTVDVVLSPHTEYIGHQLLIAPDERNKGQVVIDALGPTDDGTITDADVSDSDSDVLPDGKPVWGGRIHWTNPTSDSNFWTTRLYVQLVDNAGNPSPDPVWGSARKVGDFSGPGASAEIVIPYTWNVHEAPYNYLRFSLRTANHLDDETVQTSAWSGGTAAYLDVEQDQDVFPGYPTLDSILEEGGLVGNQPWVKLTFNYTAPSSNNFLGFTLFFSDDGGTTWKADEGYRRHAGGADGLTGSVHVWMTKPEGSDLTLEVVLSPHTTYQGHILLIASDNRNKGQVVVDQLGATDADTVTDAAVSDAQSVRDIEGKAFWGGVISWTNPSSDSNFWTTRLYVQLVNSSGTPSSDPVLGSVRKVGDVTGPGAAASITIENNWHVHDAPFNVLRFSLKTVNHLGQETTQTTAWSSGTAAYFDVTQSEPSGGLNAGKLDPDTLEGGLTRTATGLKAGNADTFEVFNPGFEDGLSHWTLSPAGAWALDSSVFYSGTNSVRCDGDPTTYKAIYVGDLAGVQARRLPIRHTDQLRISVYHRTSGSPDGYIAIRFDWYDASDSLIGTSPGATSAAVGSTWTDLQHTVTPPANAVRTVVLVFTANQTTGSWYVDHVRVTRAVVGDEIADSALGEGLERSGETLRLKLSSDNLQFGASDELELNLGDGLQTLSNALTVDLGTGLTTSAGSVVVELGDGITAVGNAISVNVGAGLEVNVGQVQVKTGDGVELSGGFLQAKYNSTYLSINGSGQLEVAGVEAPDVIAGQLVVGVTMVASQVISGTFSGISMQLNKNGITTTLGNAYDGISGTYVGLKVENNSSGAYTIVTNDLFCMFDSGGQTLIYIEDNSGYGRITLGETNVAGITHDSSGGFLRLNGQQVVSARSTGWTAFGGTSDKSTSLNTESPPSNTLLARRLKAIQDALATHGLISA